MRPLDRVLQRWRMVKAASHIPRGARLLDVGCRDGALFRFLGTRVSGGVGIDPALEPSPEQRGVRFIRGRFPQDLDAGERFDAITMLAVFEHLVDREQRTAIAACAELLPRGGRLVLTVPSPAVDRIVHALAAVGLLAGLSIHEHHGFDVTRTPEIVTNGSFALLRHERFELGLNNLFVFERI